MARELKTSDIARLHGVSRRTAYAWLVEIERKYGPSVVCRRGKRGDLVTTTDAFAKVAPLVASSTVDERRIKALEDRMTDAEVRADATAARLSQVERDVRAGQARAR